MAPSITAGELRTSIEIDGILDESVWSTAEGKRVKDSFPLHGFNP